MSYTFHDLDENTRALMLKELRADIGTGSVYPSARFRPGSQPSYEQALENAFSSGTADTLAASIEGLIKDGSPVNAALLLAGDQFNLYYIRAIARRAVESGQDDVTIYRAKLSEEPRPESLALVGTTTTATSLLDDLRSNTLTPWKVRVPKVGSGLSVRL